MNSYLEKLEKIYLEEYGNTSIGDTDEAAQLSVRAAESMQLENILTVTYNLIKVNQLRIKRLERNLDLLASRVYNTADDFTHEEIEEIAFALTDLNKEQLMDVDNFKDHLHDSLYCNLEDFELMDKQQKQLMGKIKYPTRKMNDTFNKMVTEQLLRRNDLQAIN